MSECLELQEEPDDYNKFGYQDIETGLLEVPTISVGGLVHFVENGHIGILDLFLKVLSRLKQVQVLNLHLPFEFGTGDLGTVK